MEQESARIPLPQRVETLVKTDVIKNLQSRPKKKKNLQELPKLIHLKPNITVENSVKGSLSWRMEKMRPTGDYLFYLF